MGTWWGYWCVLEGHRGHMGDMAGHRIRWGDRGDKVGGHWGWMGDTDGGHRV